MERAYVREILDWQWNQIELRKKYRDTPPGFRTFDEEKKAIDQWQSDRERYDKKKTYTILSEYRPSDEIFTGRRDILDIMYQKIQEKQEPVILYGIGGIGKSALARAYAREHEKEYKYIIFLPYNVNIRAMVCDDCNLKISNLQYTRERYGSKAKYFQLKCRIFSEICSKEKILLIIDNMNVDYDKDLSIFLDMPCDCIVTTRIDPVLWGNYEGIRVRKFQTEEEWQCFIEAYQPRKLSGQELESIYAYRRKVNGHTLKMMMEIRSIGEREATSDNFEEDLFERFRLKKADKQALMYLSIMPVQGIPQKLLQKVSGVRDETIERLLHFLFIKTVWNQSWKDMMLYMHPVIAQAVIKVFRPSPVNCSRLLEGFGNYMQDIWDFNYMENQRLEPYVFALMRAFPKPVAWQAGAFSRISTALWLQGYYQEAERYILKLFEAVKEYYGEYHQITGSIAMRVAAAYYNGMDFKRAGIYYDKALNILENCKPYDRRYKILLGEIYGKQSRILRYRGDLEAALEADEKSIFYTRENEYQNMSDTNVEDRVRYAYSLLSKGKTLFRMGRLDEAEEILNEAMERLTAEEITGFRWNEFNNLRIEILVCQKKYGSAEELAKMVLNNALSYRGEAFKDTLSCREQLGDIYTFQEKWEEALFEYGKVRGLLRRDYPYQVVWRERIDEKIEKILAQKC